MTYDRKDTVQVLKKIATEIGVLHIAHLRLDRGKSTDARLLTALVTYPAEWKARYFLKQYIFVDPVISHGRDAVVPFDWGEFNSADPAIAAMFADAARFGVGRNGLSVPIRIRSDVTAVVSFTSDVAKPEWEIFKNENLAGLQVLSLLIDSAARSGGKLTAPHSTLSQREEQCLIWAARGKTYQEIGEILDLTFGSVKTHLNIARRKLRCLNLTHAAAYAVATGVISATTLEQSDRTSAAPASASQAPALAVPAPAPRNSTSAKPALPAEINRE